MSKFLSFLRLVSPLILFVLFFGGFFLLFSSAWISSMYGEVTFLQILFHLQFPMNDVDPKFLRSFRQHVIFPSVILSAILSLSPLVFKALKAFFRKILKRTKNFSAPESTPESRLKSQPESRLEFCAPFFFTLFFFFVIFFALWIYRVYAFYAPTTLEKFLFELKLPEIPLFVSFTKRVLFPSVLLSVLIFCVPIYHCCKETIPRFYRAMKCLVPQFYTALREFINRIYAYCKAHSHAFVLSAQYGGVIALILGSLNLVDKKFGAFKALFRREDSTLFEEHYKPFALKIHSAPKNLIVIFVESLESTFSLKSVIGGGGGNMRLLASFCQIFQPLQRNI